MHMTVTWISGPAMRWVKFIVLVAVFPCGSISAEATTVADMSNRALTESAEVIVVGRCTSVRSAWEGRTLITLATIEVSESIKGGQRNEVTVRLPGGIDARRKFPVSMTYAGAPQIAMGEEVFLFLGRGGTPADGLTVLGFSQGKFSIVSDESGELMVSRNLSAVTLTSPAGTRRGTASRMPLARFRSEIPDTCNPDIGPRGSSIAGPMPRSTGGRTLR